MITKEQAMELVHGSIVHLNGCKREVGPRGGVTEHVERYRVASRIRTWSDRSGKAGKFEFTVKHGMNPRTYVINGPSGTANSMHIESECPLRNES